MAGKVRRDLFYKLASDLPDERLQAAVAVIQDLAAVDLPEGSEEWSYVLGRLVNGLASSRNSARLGFSMCLTEVVNLALSRQPKPDCLDSVDKYLDKLAESLPTKKLKKGKDERGVLFGRMFGLQAIVADSVFTKLFVDQHGKVTTAYHRVLRELIELALVKSWIREPCLYTLFQVIQKSMQYIGPESVTLIFGLLDEHELSMTNEGLAIYVLLLYCNKNFHIYEVITQREMVHKSWKNNDPLSRGNLPDLSRTLLNSAISSESNTETSANGKQSMNWNPRLHFVWDILLPLLVTPTTNKDAKHISKKRKKSKHTGIEFPEFWQMVVDESFFNEKASSERKYLGFLVVQRTLPIVPDTLIEECLSPNILRSLVNQSTDSKRFLHKMAKKTLDDLVKICEKDTNKIAGSLKALLFGNNGSLNFDRLTKTKTISTLLSSKDMPPKVVSDLLKMFQDFLTSNLDKPNEVRFGLDTILHIIRSHKQATPNILSSLHELLKQLVQLAFFESRASELARERLFSIMADLPPPSTSEHSWPYQVLRIVQEIKASGQNLVNDLDDSLAQIEADGTELLQHLSQDKKHSVGQCIGLEILLSMALIQIYSGEEDAVGIVEDILTFANTENKNVTSLEGIIEILLSLLAQKKAVLRKLSMSVWEKLIGEVGTAELQLLIDVLRARENKQGFAQLFEGAGEYIDDSDNEDGKNEKASGDESGGSNSSDSDSSSDESESDDDDDDENRSERDDEVLKIERDAGAAIAEALKLPKGIIKENGEVDFTKLNSESEGDDDDDDDDEISEESMDDEQMIKIDEQLSAIFKQRKEALEHVSTGNQRKIDVKESRENVIAFKHRITDMLEVYMKHIEKLFSNKEQSIESAHRVKLLHSFLLLIEPLVSCVQHTLDRPLADKIAKLLKSRVFKIMMSQLGHNAEVYEEADKVLARLYKLLLLKPGHHATAFYSSCSATSLFLSKLLVESAKSPDEAIDHIIDVYAGTIKAWLHQGKSKCYPNVFTDLLQWLFNRKQATASE